MLGLDPLKGCQSLLALLRILGHLPSWVKSSTSIRILLSQGLVLILATLAFGTEPTPVSLLTSGHTLLILLRQQEHVISLILDIDDVGIVSEWLHRYHIGVGKVCL